MANINIKTNFVDGEKLFAQQLNNNFRTIQEGMNADNKIIWQDGTEVLFKRYITDDIDNLPIMDGSIIYDIEKGRHYIDYNGVRIQVGSAGKEVVVQEEEPTEEDTKLWIDTDVLNNIGTEIINSLDGNETNRAPSVDIIKKALYYQPGDSVVIDVSRATGHITGSSKSVNFLLPLSKQFSESIKGATATGEIKMRQAGNYVPANDWINMTASGRVSCALNPSGVFVVFAMNEAPANVINNDVVALELQNIVIKFN